MPSPYIAVPELAWLFDGNSILELFPELVRTACIS